MSGSLVRPIRPRPGKWAGVALLTVLLTAGAGCSRVDMAYTLAEWTLLKRLDHYFNLTPAQESFLEGRIQLLLDWHQREELPLLVKRAAEFKARYAHGLGKEDLLWFQETHKGFWRRFFLRGSGDFAAFLTTLNPEQVAHFRGQMEERNQSWIEQVEMTAAAQREDTLAWLTEYLEDWLGGLDEGQLTRIQGWLADDPEWPRLVLDNRRIFQKAMGDLAASARAEGFRGERLQLWIERPDSLWTPAFKSRWPQKKEEWYTLVLNVDRITTPEQRDHALQKLDGFLAMISPAKA
ncbi:MAG: DUF6279 family lipoprotein [Nitrospinaceae bacterium]